MSHRRPCTRCDGEVMRCQRSPAGRSRLVAVIQARQRAKEVARLGARVRQARARRGWSQHKLAVQVGITRFRIGQIERGDGAGVPLDLWHALGLVLKLPLRIEFGRDALERTDRRRPFEDAGAHAPTGTHARHNALLRDCRTRSTDPALSVDVGWRDDARRALILNECWNTFGNINAAVRQHPPQNRRGEPACGHAWWRRRGICRCGVLDRSRHATKSRTDRSLPEVFATAFPASSSAWVRALTTPAAPVPTETGLVWSDVQANRLFPWRQSRLRASPD